MKRFYGSAIFEGEEVADSAFTQLENTRAEEQRRIEYYETEFRMQIDELNQWKAEELSAIDTDAYNQINELHAFIAHCYRQIYQIKSNAAPAITKVQSQSFLRFHVKLTREENDAVAQIRSETSHQIAEQHALILHAQQRIASTQWNRVRLIAQVHRDYAIEYNIRLTRRDKDIAWAHSDATDKIAAVIARRYYLPVFMLRCAKGPCEFCRAKYGTTGTYDELVKLSCVPPFHDDCRCWHEEVGYVVMTH